MPAVTIDSKSRFGPTLILPGGIVVVSNPANVTLEYAADPVNGPWNTVPIVGTMAKSERSQYVRAIAVAGTVDVEVDNSASAMNRFEPSLPDWNFDQNTVPRVVEGTNARQGLTAPMVAGTLLVANSSITATSRLQLTRQAGGTNPGAVYESARVAGTSFTVTSTNVADTGQVAFDIFEPA